MPVAKQASPPAPFTGFGAEAFATLSELAANNDRAWFLANKSRYDTHVRAPMMSLVASLSLALAVRELPLTGDPAKSLFRVNRDVRFSNDKRPYKINVSAVLTRDGIKQSQGLLYLHVQPGECFAAAGFYGLQPDELAAMRSAIAGDARRWLALTAALAKAGLTLSRDNAAVRLPRGFDEADPALHDALKLRQFTVSRPLDPAALGSADVVDTIVDFAATALPLLRFGWAALSALPPRRA